MNSVQRLLIYFKREVWPNFRPAAWLALVATLFLTIIIWLQ